MPDVEALRPKGLGPRGSALWTDLVAEADSVARLTLAGEAARLADRLDKLDELLSGDIDAWCHLTHRLMTTDYELKIDAAASEARQSAGALRQILSQLNSAESEPSTGGSFADELAARRADREADATG